MKLQMSQITNFAQFYEEVKRAKLSLKILFKLDTLTRAIENQLQFYHIQLQEILVEGAVTDEKGQFVYTEDGGGVKLIPEKAEWCQEKFNELQTLEVELPDIKFDIDDFGNIELTMESFNIIRPFLN